MKSGKTNNETYFSKDLIPLEKESLFQNIIISKISGEEIIISTIKDALEYFNLFIKNKLKTANSIINKVHGFLKIIVLAIKNKNILKILLKFFSEIFII
jgi:hypothetical protein